MRRENGHEIERRRMDRQQALVDHAGDHVVECRVRFRTVHAQRAGEIELVLAQHAALDRARIADEIEVQFVSQPSPVNPRPPCSAETAGSAPASASGKTGYAFLSNETGAAFGAGAAGALLAAVDAVGSPPPQAASVPATRRLRRAECMWRTGAVLLYMSHERRRALPQYAAAFGQDNSANNP